MKLLAGVLVVRSLKFTRSCPDCHKNLSYKSQKLLNQAIDRIDSNLDYHLVNIQIVHKDVNLMKNRFSQDYFLDICKKITDYRRQNLEEVGLL